MLGVMISQEEYKEYMSLKKKNTPMKKEYIGIFKKHCPVCGYVVDDLVPPQNYCDICGQRLIK